MIDKRAIGEESKTIKKIRRVKQLLNVVLCIIIIPILVVNLTMLIKKITNRNKTPDFLGYKFFVILTGSMEETLHVGDFIVVKEEPEKNLKEQDIITFNSDKTTITHRIVKIEYKDGKTLYTTKGDNNNSEDSKKLNISQIEGRYISRIPVVGKIVTYLQKPIVLTIMIVLPIIIGLISFKINNHIAQKQMIRKTKRLKYDGEVNEKENKKF